MKIGDLAIDSILIGDLAIIMRVLNMMLMVLPEYCKRMGQLTLNSDDSSEDSPLSLVQSLIKFM